MKKKLVVVLALLAGVSAAVAKEKECSVVLTVTGVSAVYDPFENSFAPIPIAINVQTNANCKGERLQIALAPTATTPSSGTPEIALAAGGNSLAGMIESNGAPLVVRNEASAFASNATSYSLGNASAAGAGAGLQLDLKPGQVSPPGAYGALLKVLYRVVDSNGVEISSGNTSVSISVTAKPSVRLAAVSDLVIDVGEIQPGLASQAVKFDSYSNIDYELVLSSEHDFTLVRDGTGPVAEGASYLPQIDGKTVTAISASNGSGIARKVQFSAPGKRGRSRQSFAIRMLKFSDKAAGNYSDLVTMEIRAKI